jgi:hypothetical protein
MKLRHLLFSAATTLLSLTAHADTDDKAGPCVHLRSFQACVNYPSGECFWDASDFRCESRFDRGESGGGGFCGNLSYSPCVRDFRCFWDGSDNRCETR